VIPADVAFACDHDDPPVVFVPFETIMTLRYDAIAVRQVEIERPWDEIEIRRGDAEAGGTAESGDGRMLTTRPCGAWWRPPLTGARSPLRFVAVSGPCVSGGVVFASRRRHPTRMRMSEPARRSARTSRNLLSSGDLAAQWVGLDLSFYHTTGTTNKCIAQLERGHSADVTRCP
jgi:hypothetical protein